MLSKREVQTINKYSPNAKIAKCRDVRLTETNKTCLL
jgi:hypothetical protein